MRSYKVRYVPTNDPTEPLDGIPHYVVAPGPKAAVAKVAAFLLPFKRLQGRFEVTALHDKQSLDHGTTRAYWVSLDRHVRDISRAS